MSKNLTLKGAAFGALVALSISAVAPASAAGLADTSFVSLAPKTGTEYSVLAGAGKTFTLTANEASTIAGGDLKHLVTDASDLISTTSATTGREIVFADGAVVDVTKANPGVINVTDAAAAAQLATGDVISFKADFLGDLGSGTDTDVVADADTAFVVTVTGNDISFTSTTDHSALAAAVTNGTLSNTDAEVTFEVIREARNTTTHTFVIDSGIHTAATNEDVVLVSDSDTTRSVTVQAWVDSNDNDTIDSTEYTSPVRTVTFVKTTEVAMTTTLVSPVVGDSVLTAKITTSPVLNGQQVDAQDGSAVFGAYFTRQDSTSTGVAAVDGDSAWNDTTKEWTATVSMEVTALQGAVNDANWPGIMGTGTTGVTIVEATTAIASNVATVVTDTAHGLRAGDKVTISGITTGTELNATHTITSVPSATSFKFAVTATDRAAGAVAGTGIYSVATYATNQAITDRVFPGTHTAKAAIGAVKLGTAASAGTGASSSADSTLSIAASASVQPGEFAAVDNANNIEVKKGTTSVAVTVAVVDSSEVAVSAGRPVVISLGAPNEGAQAGTFKVNGLTAPQTLLTDAAGKVTFTVSEDDGDVAAQVRITATPEGLSGAASSADLIWNDAAYTLYDLNSPATARVADRTVNKNGSLEFKLALLDQWKAAPADGTYRLLVKNTGNTVSSAYATLVSGKADVTVADGQIGAGTSITTAVEVEKLVTATWTYQPTISWQAVSNNDGALGVITTNIKDQTDKVNLDADGATLYGNDTADLSDAVTAKTVVAQDRRTANLAQPLYGSAVTVTGNVTNSVTAAARAGAVVTLSGPSNILFSEGGLDSFGSITVIADANGEFGVDLISAVAQASTVITVTSNGVSSTVKVSFTGVSTSAKILTVTPANTTYVPGQTVVYTIKLTDTLGNPVDTSAAASPATAAYITVTYAGPGVISGSLPVETDASGEATVRISTGAADSAAAVLTVKYDQNFDGDVLDTNDLTVSSSVSASNPSASVATVTVTAATTSQVGRAIDVTVKAVDAAGVAVAGAVVALSSTGAGSLSASSVVTNASGVAVVKLVAGASDLGSAVVTATSNGKSSAPATVEFGATDATVDIIGKRVYVTTEFAAGKRVTIYDNGVRRYSAIQTTDAEKVVMWNVKSGSHTIVVKISGASSDAVTFLVK